METKTLRIDGVDYRIRYMYTRDDGSKWYVLDTDRLMGKYGDEWPVKQTFTMTV